MNVGGAIRVCYMVRSRHKFAYAFIILLHCISGLPINSHGREQNCTLHVKCGTSGWELDYLLASLKLLTLTVTLTLLERISVQFYSVPK